MNDNIAYNSKKEIFGASVNFYPKNQKKVMKPKEQLKSYNIEIHKNKNEINNINSINSNIANKNNDEKRQILIQERQKRDTSKKAKRVVVHKSKINHQNDNNNIQYNNKTNIKNVQNKEIENNDKIVEDLLKSKVKSINPNVKDINKNYLKMSINGIELNNKEFRIKKENNIIKSQMPWNNNKPVLIKNNILDEKEVLNNNYFIETKKEAQKNSEQPFNQIKIKDEKNNNINQEKNKIVGDKDINKETTPNNKIDVSNLLVPLTNFTKENNCFLNVLIQTLYNLDEFREYLLAKIYSKSQNEVVKELCSLINSYKNIQEKFKYTSEKIEPTLSVNNLRTYLNNIYGNYRKGECGDPMETLEHLFDLTHKEYLSINPNKKNNCNCPSHNYFFLDLSELKYCKICHQYESRKYSEDCYMFNIFASDIINKIKEKNQDFNSYKSCLFSKIKEQNELYENPNKEKFEKCQCEKGKFHYLKKIRSNNSDNSYLIINITWAEEFPNMKDILTIFCLMPIFDKNKHLFSVKDENTRLFYIKAIILYGIYHYVCVIYINTQKKWGIIDDKTIKYIDKYYDLTEYLLKNHLMPVGLVYSQNKRDKIEINEIQSNNISEEVYKKLYKFVEEVENWKKTKKPSISLSKGSFNETNENYLDNNLFYKSIISLYNSSCDSDYEDVIKMNEIKISAKTSINKINIKEDNDKKKEIFGRKFMGDFSENNLKGGLIVFQGEDDEEDKDNDFNNFDNKKEKEEVYMGKSYSRFEK